MGGKVAAETAAEMGTDRMGAVEEMKSSSSLFTADVAADVTIARRQRLMGGSPVGGPLKEAAAEAILMWIRCSLPFVKLLYLLGLHKKRLLSQIILCSCFFSTFSRV